MNSKYIKVLLAISLGLIPIVSFAKSGVRDIYHKGWIDFNKNGKKDIYEDHKQPIDKRVQDLLSQMTLDEKSCQLATLYGYGRVLNDSLPTSNWKYEIWKDGIANIDEQLNGVGKGYNTAYNLIYPFSNHVEALYETQKWFIENTRLGIPVEFSNEGIHGLNHTKCTPLPAPVGIGCSWNRQLVLEAGTIVGKEARSLGYHSVYAPILDLARDPRWGRTLECYGEDPYLVAELGTNMVKGIQSQKIGSTLKHFAVYSVPKGGRDGNCRTDPHVTPRELHEIHLYPFKKVIKSAAPWGIMSSYNDWNGEPVSASNYFLTELLRNEYGFGGYVVSDSEAVEFVYTKHKTAETYDEAVLKVLEAGLNVRTHFTHPKDFIMPIRRLYEKKILSDELLDKRVGEVLRVKFIMGLFDNPFGVDSEKADEIAGADRHLSFTENMQRQSLVLLKNENNLLPLDKDKLKNVLVTGPLADEDNFMISRYGPNGLDNITVFEGIKRYLSSSATVHYSKGCDVVDTKWPESEIIPEEPTETELESINDAVRKAMSSDIVIAVMGEDEFTTGESRSRTSLDLPGHQRLLLKELYKTGKPIVLVLINGQPLTINWENAKLPAILEAWFPCYNGGDVIARTLFGEFNPSGKLSVTFPKSIGQIEYNYPYKKGSHGDQPNYGPNGSGNTRVIGALYPFGYGLSYTSFLYSDIKVNASEFSINGNIKVSVKITNTGKYAGEEIVQLYLRDLYSSVVTYDSVLRGFEKIYLRPGETKEIYFTLKEEDLKILDKDMQWNVEPGDFEICIGASSEDIRLKEKITISE